MGKNNPELWNFFPELLNWSYFYSSHILVWNLVPLFSGQDEVQTSNLIACHHVTFCVQVSCISPTDIMHHSKLIAIIISWLTIHIVNYHCLPSLFSEVSTELIQSCPVIHRVIPPWSSFSLIDCKAGFSSSLNYSIGSSGFLFALMTCCWIGPMAEKM